MPAEAVTWGGLPCFSASKFDVGLACHGLAHDSSVLVAGFPYDGRDIFLVQVDSLIAHLERVLSNDGDPNLDATDQAPSHWRRGSGNWQPRGFSGFAA